MQGKNRGETRANLAAALVAATAVGVPSIRAIPGATGRSAGRSAVRGFTLIELMVTLAVVAILAAAATPAMQSLVNGNRLRSAANETVASLQSARLEAIRVNRRTVACLSVDPNAAIPSCAAAGATGWIVFQDADRDGQYDVAERLVRRATVAGNVQLLGSTAFAGRVTFNSDGMARDAGGNLLNAAVGACLPILHPQENERDISIGAGSRIRVTSKNAGGKCLAPGDKP
ncbi:GspH/FimT family pseudopilin [Lysobacter yangpyeongensis]|uniref:Type II secretion system protein H n=1 Tax=Lysobacter yangpyeongensis TaxID=346182 RepID=A0ABW0SKQ6_9GAMM